MTSSFTSLSVSDGPEELIKVLNEYYRVTVIAQMGSKGFQAKWNIMANIAGKFTSVTKPVPQVHFAR